MKQCIEELPCSSGYMRRDSSKRVSVCFFDLVLMLGMSILLCSAGGLPQSSWAASPAADSAGSALVVIESQPAADARDVPVGQQLTVHLNKRVDPATLNAQTVTLMGPSGAAAVKLVVADGGLALFITPFQELLPASRYTLFIQGASDEEGQKLPFTAIGFNTAALSAGGESAKHPRTTAQTLDSAEDDEEWIPNAGNRNGNWQSGRASLAEKNMPRRESLRRALYGRYDQPPVTNWATLKAALDAKAANSGPPPGKGMTALAGQVLRLNGRPLADVTVEMGSATTKTDGNGEFLLNDVPSGYNQLLIVDGGSANRRDATYGRFTFVTNVLPGQTNDLDFVVWMPKLDMRHAVTIASPTTRETVISNPNIPGVELVLPPGAVIRDAHGRIATQVSITPIPVDQTPFPMPYFDVPVYFTLQPGGAVIQGVDGKPKGALLRYPNYSAFGPDHLVKLFDYDPNGRGWYSYGTGKVSDDGRKIVSGRDFTIYQFTANGASSGYTKPDVPLPKAPPPPECDVPSSSKSDSASQNPGDASGSQSCNESDPGWYAFPDGGDPVNLATGVLKNVETDMTVADVVPIALTRTYRTLDKSGGTDILRPFGIASSHPYEMYLDMPAGFTQINLVLPDGTVIPFTSIALNPTSYHTDYRNTVTAGQFYQSIIHYDAANNSQLTLYFRDGRRWGFFAHTARLQWIDDRNGNRVTVSRAGGLGTGSVTQIMGPSGRYINLSYNANGQISQAKDHTGRTVTYGYDAGKRLTTVTDPTSGVRTYVWDTGNNRISSIKDAKNTTTVSITYDGNGRVSGETLADSSTFGFAYTLSSGVVTRTEVTDRRSNVRRVDFNSAGQITANTFPLGLTEEQVTSFTLDSTTGRVTSMTDALSRRTDYTYDSLGNVTQITRLAGTGDAVSSSATYDTTYSRPLTITDANNKTTTLTYDANGNLTQISDPLSHTTQMTYDGQGRVLTVVDGLSHTVATLTYSGPDLASVTDALSRTTSFYTDGAGRLTGIKDPLGRFTTKSYDVLNRLTQITDALSGTLQFTYDANSNLLTHVDPNSHTTTYTYDAMDRAATRVDALTHTESYAYESGGRLNKITDRKSQVSGMTYDGVGRVTLKGYGATTGNPTTYTDTVSLTWDKGNRVTQIVDTVGGTINRTYDGLDRLTEESTTQGTVDYTYDAGGRRTSMTVTGQPAISYTWDDANRLTQIQQAAGSSNNNTAQTIGFTYDNANRRTVTTLANGSTLNYAYDNASQLSSITYQKADTTVIGDLSYTYDDAGRRIQTSGSLAAVDLPSTVSSPSYNANNQLTSWAGSTYTYDLNGNLTSDGSITYTWDARNQLASLSSGATASFSYDGTGRRIGKTIGTTTTGYVYDGMNYIQEKDGTGGTANVVANFITGLTLDDTYARMTGSNPSAVISHFLPDANNNVIKLLDGTQAIADSYSYEAYGTTTHGTGTDGNSQQYTGRENDGTGLYYYRARYYLPSAGRFIAEDPIGLNAGPNVYAYVGGDPISNVDPSGLLGLPWPFNKRPEPIPDSRVPEPQPAPKTPGAPKNTPQSPEFCSQTMPTYQQCVSCCQGQAQRSPFGSGAGSACREQCSHRYPPYPDAPFETRFPSGANMCEAQ